MKEKTFKKLLNDLKIKKRDDNIQAHIKREIDISVRKVKSKKIYSRKNKHKINY